MRRALRLLLLPLAVAAGGLPVPARAAAAPAAQAQAPSLEEARAQAAAARAELAAVRSKQAALRTELNALGAQIEALKAERQGKLRAGDALEGALRRSQELSDELTQLAQTAAAAEALGRARSLALHAALGAELVRLRGAWEATSDREARAALIARMRPLRAERDAVRAALPEGELPALALDEGRDARPGTSDDPEDLLEQADALRDSRDKVRQRLAALQGHIAELREARDLERRMSDFLGDEAMFDEQDRRLQMRRDATAGLRVERTRPSDSLQGTPTFSDPTPAPESGSPAPVAPPPPAPPPSSEPVTGPTTPGTPPPADVYVPPPVSPSTAVPPARASDVRPQVGGVRAQVLAGGDGLAQLEEEAARLEALARDLERRAAALEARGRTRE